MSHNREPRQEDQRETSAPEQAPKSPSHVAYSVRETREGESYFNRVGAAFPHKDGQGFNINLEAFPTNGKVVLRTPQERLQEQRQPDQRQGRKDRDNSR